MSAFTVKNRKGEIVDLDKKLDQVVDRIVVLVSVATVEGQGETDESGSTPTPSTPEDSGSMLQA